MHHPSCPGFICELRAKCFLGLCDWEAEAEKAWVLESNLLPAWVHISALPGNLENDPEWIGWLLRVLDSLATECGEGDGTPLQCSCLENPRDGAAWWAAVYGVTQSRTRLRWLSSSSSYRMKMWMLSQVLRVKKCRNVSIQLQLCSKYLYVPSSRVKDAMEASLRGFI